MPRRVAHPAADVEVAVPSEEAVGGGGAAAPPLPSRSDHPSVPLYPLLSSLVICWLLKRFLLWKVFTYKRRTLFARSIERRLSTVRHGKNGGPFELSREELEAQLRGLKRRNINGSNSRNAWGGKAAGESPNGPLGGGGSGNNEGDMGAGGMADARVLREELSRTISDGARREAALLASLEAKTALYNDTLRRAEQLSRENAALSKRVVALEEENEEELELEVELQEQLSNVQNEKASLEKQVTRMEERAGRLEEENILLKKRVNELKRENEEMDVEMERLMDEMDGMCNEDDKNGEHEGEELEFDRDERAGSWLQESLTEDDDSGDDDKEEREAMLLQVAKLQSEKDALQASIDQMRRELHGVRASIANMMSEQDATKGENDALRKQLDQRHQIKERSLCHGDLTPTFTAISSGSLSSSSYHTMESYERLRAEKDELQRSLLEIHASLKDVHGEVMEMIDEMKADIENNSGGGNHVLSEDGPGEEDDGGSCNERAAPGTVSEMVKRLSSSILRRMGLAKDLKSKLLSAVMEKSESNVAAVQEEVSSLSNKVTKLRDAKIAAEERSITLESELEAAIVSKTHLNDQLVSLRTARDAISKQLLAKETALEESQSDVAATKEELSSVTLRFSEEVTELSNAKIFAEESVTTLEGSLKAERLPTAANLTELTNLRNAKTVVQSRATALENKLEAAIKSKTRLSDQVASHQRNNEDLANELSKNEAAATEPGNAKVATEELLSGLTSKLESEQFKAATELLEVESKLKAIVLSNTQLTDQVASLQHTINDLSKNLRDKEIAMEEVKPDPADKVVERGNAKGATEERVTALEGKLRGVIISKSEMTGEVASLRNTIDDMTKELREKVAELIEGKSVSDALTEEASSTAIQLSKDATELRDAKVAAEEQVSALKGELQAEQPAAASALIEVSKLRDEKTAAESRGTSLESELGKAIVSSTQLAGEVVYIHNTKRGVTKQLRQKEALLEKAHSSIALMKEETFTEITKLQNAKVAAEEKVIRAEGRVTALESELRAEQLEAATILAEWKCRFDEVIKSNTHLTDKFESLHMTNEYAANRLREKGLALEEADSNIATMKAEASSSTLQFSEEMNQLRNTKVALEEKVASLESKLGSEYLSAVTKFTELEGKLETAISSNADLADEVASLQNINEDLVNQFCEKESELDGANSVIATMKEFSKEVTELRHAKAEQLTAAKTLCDAKVAAEERAAALEGKLEVEQLTAAKKLADVQGKLESASYSNSQLMDQVSSLQNANEKAMEEAKSNLAAMQAETKAATSQLSAQAAELSNAKTAAEERVAALESKLKKERLVTVAKLAEAGHKLQASNLCRTHLTNEVSSLLSSNEKAMEEANSKIAAMATQVTELENVKTATEKQVATLERTLEEEQLAAGSKLVEVEGKLDAVMLFNTQLKDQVARLQNANEKSIEESKSKIAAMQEAASVARSQLSDQAMELDKDKTAEKERVAALENKFEKERLVASSKLADVEGKLEAAILINENLSDQVAHLQNANENTKSEIAALQEEVSAATSQLSDQATELDNAKAAAEERAAAIQSKLEEERFGAVAKVTEMEGKLKTAILSNTHLIDQNISLQNAKDDAMKVLLEKEAALEEFKSTIATMKEDSYSSVSQLSEEVSKLRTAKIVAEEQVSTLTAKLGDLTKVQNARITAEEQATTLESKLKAATHSNTQLADKAASLQSVNKDLTKKLHDKDILLLQSKYNIAAVKEEASFSTSKLSKEVTELRDEKGALEKYVNSLESYLKEERQETATILIELQARFDAVVKSKTDLEDKVASLQSSNEEVAKQLCEMGSAFEEANSKIGALKEEASYSKLHFSEEVTELRIAKGALEEQVTILGSKLGSQHRSAASKLADVKGKLDAAIISNTQLTDEVASLQKIKEHATKQQVASVTKLAEVEGKLKTAILSITHMTDQVASIQKVKEYKTKLLSEKEAELEVSKSTIVAMKEESSSAMLKLSEELRQHRSANVALGEQVTVAEERAASLGSKLEVERSASLAMVTEMKGSLEATIKVNASLTEQVASLQNDKNNITNQLHAKGAELEESICQNVAIKEEAASAKKELSDKVAELRNVEKQAAAAKRSALTKLSDAKAEKELRVNALESELEAVCRSKTKLEDQVASLKNAKECVMKQLSETEGALEESKLDIAAVKEETSTAVSQFAKKESELHRKLEEQVTSLESKLESEQLAASIKLAEVEAKLETAILSKAKLTDQVASLQNIRQDATERLSEKEVALEELKSKISSQLPDELKELRHAKVVVEEMAKAAEDRATTFEGKLESEQQATAAVLAEANSELESATASNIHFKDQVVSLQNIKENMAKEVCEKEATIESYKSKMAAMEEKTSSVASQLSDKVSELHIAKAVAEERVTTLECKIKAAILSNSQLTGQVASLQNAKVDAARHLREREAALEESKLINSKLLRAKAAAEENITTLERKVKTEQLMAAAKLAEMEGKLEATMISYTQLTDQLATLQSAKEDTIKQLHVKELALKEAESNIAATKEDASKEMTELCNAKCATEERVTVIESNLETEQLAVKELGRQLEIAEDDNARMTGKISAFDGIIQDLKFRISLITKEKEEVLKSLENVSDKNNKIECQLSKLQEEHHSLTSKIETTSAAKISAGSELEQCMANLEPVTAGKEELAAELSNTEAKFKETIFNLESRIQHMTESYESLNAENDKLERQLLKNRVSLKDARLTIKNTNDDLAKQVHENESAQEEAKINIAALTEEASSAMLQLSDEMIELRDAKADLIKHVTSAEDHIKTLEREFKAKQLATQDLERQLKIAENDIIRLTKRNNASGEMIRRLESNMCLITREKKEATQTKETAMEANDILSHKLSRIQANYDSLKSELHQQNSIESELKQHIASTKYGAIESELKQCMDTLERVTADKDKLENAVVRLAKEVKASGKTVQDLQANVCVAEREKQEVTDENRKLILQLSKLRGKYNSLKFKLRQPSPQGRSLR